MKSAHPFFHDLARFLPAVPSAIARQRYFAGDTEAMWRALRTAEARGLVEISGEMVRGHYATEPIAIVKAGETPPPAGRIAYEGNQRWSEDVSPRIVIRGTAKLCAFFGGEERVIASAHLSHDLALSNVFLLKRLSEPTFEWSLIRQTSRSGVLADAVSATGYVELVGRYSAASVSAKLTLAGTANLELW